MYLQMSGDDSYLQAPSITFDEIAMDILTDKSTGEWQYWVDCRNGVPSTYYFHEPDGSEILGGFNERVVDGVSGANVPSNTRCELQLLKGSSGTDDITFFAYSSTYKDHMKGNIYDIKVYNVGILVAHYDMSTGTVQDQSGNGNHAILNGGTWVDEGGGGTAVSYDYDTLYQIYADRMITADTTASIYEAQTNQYDTEQSVFRNISQTLDARIEQYEQQTTAYDTRISVYEAITGLYDTYQEIYSDSIVRTYNYDLSFSIYTERQTEHDSKQAYYQEITTDQDLTQAIYETQTTDGNINLIISAERQQDINTIQQLYGTMSQDYDTRQTFYDEDKALIGTISLEGNRELNVYLQARAEKEVHLNAKSEKTVNLKGVIQ